MRSKRNDRFRVAWHRHKRCLYGSQGDRVPPALAHGAAVTLITLVQQHRVHEHLREQYREHNREDGDE